LSGAKKGTSSSTDSQEIAFHNQCGCVSVVGIQGLHRPHLPADEMHSKNQTGTCVVCAIQWGMHPVMLGCGLMGGGPSLSPHNAAVDGCASLPLPGAHWAGPSSDKSSNPLTVRTTLTAAGGAEGGTSSTTRCVGRGGVEGEAVPVGGPLGHKGLQTGGACGAPPEEEKQ
jgi:hypothetical protein